MRQARPSDAPFVIALLREIAEAGYSRAAPDEVREHVIAHDLAEGLGLRIVAERGDEVVGYLKLEPESDVRSMSRTMRLQMAVRGDLRGHGIGKELLRAAISWAESGGADRLEVFVRADNERAQALYRRFGFELEGRLRARVRLPDGRSVDDMVLSRLVTPAVDRV